MLESKWFIIVMMLLSVLMVYSSVKRLKMNLEDTVKDLDESRENANKMGKYAVLFFSLIAASLMLIYVVSAGWMGLLPMMVVYALIIMKLTAVMIEYGGLQETWGYGKKSFAFDKIQCWINIVTAVAVMFRFFSTGLIVF